MIAGIVEAVVVITPMEVIKVKVFNDMYRERPRYRGMFHATRDIIKRSGIVGTLLTQKNIYNVLFISGIQGLFYGLTVNTINQGTNQAIRFYLMCTQKEFYSAYDEDVVIPTPMIGIFGCIAGAASVMSNISLDVIRTRMEAMSKENKKASMAHLAQKLEQEGPKTFFKGSIVRMIRVCIDVAFTFMIYEKVIAYIYSLR